MAIFREKLKRGTIIIYVLCPHQLPIHPEKEWRGRVKQIYTSMDAVEVEVLDEGYQGEWERVSFEQVIRVDETSL